MNPIIINVLKINFNNKNFSGCDDSLRKDAWAAFAGFQPLGQQSGQQRLLENQLAARRLAWLGLAAALF